MRIDNVVDIRQTLNFSHSVLNSSVGLLGDLALCLQVVNQFGGVFVPLPHAVVDVTPNIVGDVAQMSAEFGALMREVAEDLSDGAISGNELQRVEDEAHKLRLTLYRVLGDWRRLNDA